MKKAAFLASLTLLILGLLCAAAGADTLFFWKQWQLTVRQASYDANGSLCVHLESLNEPIPMKTVNQILYSETFLLYDGEGKPCRPQGIVFPSQGQKGGRQVMQFYLMFETEAEIEESALKFIGEDGKRTLISLADFSEVSQENAAAPQMNLSGMDDAPKTQESSQPAGVFVTVPPKQTDAPQTQAGVFITVPPQKTQSPSGLLGAFATVPPKK